MKKFCALLFLISFVLACDNGSVNYNNPNIPNYQVNWQINTNLPSYVALKIPSNYIIDYNQGVKGIVVFNTGSGFNAFDLTCPNQPYTSCTAMKVNGIEAKCNCDSSVYNLFTGIANDQQYPMKPYRVEENGSMLNVFN